MIMNGYGALRRLHSTARSKLGQATVEYVVTAGMLIATVSIMAVLLYTFKEHSNRVLDLVASEYP